MWCVTVLAHNASPTPHRVELCLAHTHQSTRGVCQRKSKLKFCCAKNEISWEAFKVEMGHVEGGGRVNFRFVGPAVRPLPVRQQDPLPILNPIKEHSGHDFGSQIPTTPPPWPGLLGSVCPRRGARQSDPNSVCLPRMPTTCFQRLLYFGVLAVSLCVFVVVA